MRTKQIKFREKIFGVTYSKFGNFLANEMKLFFQLIFIYRFMQVVQIVIGLLMSKRNKKVPKKKWKR